MLRLPRPRSNPAAAGTVPPGHVTRACPRLARATRIVTRRRAANLRYGALPPTARTLRHAAATVTRWSRPPVFASLNANLRAPNGRASSWLIPWPAVAAPALTAKKPAGQETESALVAPAGRAVARKTVLPTTTCEVAEATTIRAAAATATVI